jgi:hypothetical protein
MQKRQENVACPTLNRHWRQPSLVLRRHSLLELQMQLAECNLGTDSARVEYGEDLTRVYNFSDRQLIIKSSNPDEHWRVAWEH